MALKFSAVYSVIVVRNIDLAAEKSVPSNGDARYCRDVDAVREANVISNRNFRIELL